MFLRKVKLVMTAAAVVAALAAGAVALAQSGIGRPKDGTVKPQHVGSTALVMLSSKSVATATAMRINGAPGQECAPLPNARCPAASRRTSSWPGSGNAPDRGLPPR
jgi:hypothetical protein